MSIHERGLGGFREGKDPLKNNPKAQFLFDTAVGASLAYRESTRSGDLLGQHDHKVTFQAAGELLRELYVVDPKGRLTNKLSGVGFGTAEFWRQRIGQEVSKREQAELKKQEATWRAEIARELSPVDRIIFAMKRKNPELTKKKNEFDDVERRAKVIRDDEMLSDFEDRILAHPIDRPPRVIFEDMDIAEAKRRLLQSLPDSIQKKRK